MTVSSTEFKTPALRCGRFHLDLDRPLVMGILNVTPDSFSDGGLYGSRQQAIDRALALQEEGADIIDIGGESTRPGARAVSLDEERDRVLPLVEALSARLPIPISVDTSKAALMRDAIAAGAGMINDVQALRDDGALQVLAEAPDVAVVLMHMQGEPRSMQANPQYQDVCSEVTEFLQARRRAALDAGIAANQIIADAGIGFGKTLDHNLALIRHTREFQREFGRVLLGVSRKSLFAQLLGIAEPQDRVMASVQTAVWAAAQGASILRVHDVKETVAGLRLDQALKGN